MDLNAWTQHSREFFILAMEVLAWIWLRLSDKDTQTKLARIIMFRYRLKRQALQAKRELRKELMSIDMSHYMPLSKTIAIKFYNGFNVFSDELISQQAKIIIRDLELQTWHELTMDFSGTTAEGLISKIFITKLLKNAFPLKAVKVVLRQDEYTEFAAKFKTEVHMSFVTI